jgi:hypothetical protein
MLHILVDSKTAEFLLVKLLQPEQQAGSLQCRFAAPMSSLYASARTLLIVRNEPVAVVLDAESTYPRVAAQQRQAAEEVIGDAAWRAPLRILVAVPAVDALLFRRPDAVARAYGPVPQSLLELGRISPRDAFAKLDSTVSLEQVALKIIHELDDADIAALQAESPMRELLEFLDELQRDGMVAAAASGP